jgi:hypothetical protein
MQDRMHARIRPLDAKGTDLLNRLERELHISPTSRLPDGTREYGRADLEPELDKLDPNWRRHLAYAVVRA